MFASLLFLAQAGVVISNSPAPASVPLVLPPQSVPPAAMQAPHVVRAPQERGTAQSYFSIDDYPAAALGTGAHGRVLVTLVIDPSGRVGGCTIRRPSGSSVLDSATCSILRRRARYTPAVDNNGNPAVGTIEQEIEWKLPTR